MKDTTVNEHNGTFIDWRLNLWGESIFGGSQVLHPLPDEHDDDNETLPATVATTSVTATKASSALGNPTDHIDRPGIAKPTTSDEPSATPPSDTQPSQTQPTESSSATTPTEMPTETPTETPSESFLPSFFPTFGVSKRTQIWIYGSIALIVIFCSALGVYFYVQRKKRLRNNPRDDYEFEILDDEEDKAMIGGSTGRKTKRRAGELYDAFAGESDEEVFSEDGEGDDGPYRDTIDEKRGAGHDGDEEKRLRRESGGSD